MKRYTICLMAAMLATACGESHKDVDRENDDEGKRQTMKVPKATAVSVVKLNSSDFCHEIVSNGKVIGRERADLRFPAGDVVITSVLVKNGSHVAKGQKLATLDDIDFQEKVARARTSLEKAELELKDALIGQGYDPDNTGRIPDDVMKLARLRSGYTEAEANLAAASHDLEETVLRAPFPGVIANVNGKPWNRPDATKPFCTLIGGGMDVSFTVLESELPLLAQGDRVEVASYSSAAVHYGRVTEINPVVDENGLVSVTATVGQSKGLFDGMNVKVSVQKSLGRQLVVPKSAVVLRSGRQVVFTLDKERKLAMWNYVLTGLENLDEYTISDGLEEGVEVIVSGNVNLAHESPVKIVD